MEMQTTCIPGVGCYNTVQVCKVPCNRAAREFLSKYKPTDRDYAIADKYGVSVKQVVLNKSMVVRNACIYACAN